MRYKVWVQIEAHPERAHGDNEPYNVDEPVDVAVCKTLVQANKILQKITDQFCDGQTKEHWKKEGIYPYVKGDGGEHEPQNNS